MGTVLTGQGFALITYLVKEGAVILGADRVKRDNTVVVSCKNPKEAPFKHNSHPAEGIVEVAKGTDQGPALLKVETLFLLNVKSDHQSFNRKVSQFT